MKKVFHKKSWSWPSSDALQQWQIRKLQSYLRDVVIPFSPYYGSRYRELGIRPRAIQCMDDLRQLPSTSKKDLLPSEDHGPKDFILTPERNVLARRPSVIFQTLLHGRAWMKNRLEAEYRPLHMTSTTGRSDEPIPFVYTNHDLENLALTGYRIFDLCRAETEFRLLNMFPYAPHLAFWQAYYGGTAFGVFVVHSGGGKVMGTEGQIRFLGKINPDVIIGMPTFVYHVLHQAVDVRLRCDGLRRIVLGGEKVPAGMRQKLTDLARQLGSKEIDVVSTYGFTEAKMAWSECPAPHGQAPSGYHLYPDLGIVEIIDPDTEEPMPPGSPGEIVFTPLDSRGSVVMRYRTGDLIDGGLTYDPCPHCHRQVPRLVGNISRRSEFKSMRLEKIKGTLIDFNQLEHVLDDSIEIGTWQLEIRKLRDDPLEVDELILHVHSLEHHNEQTMRQRLANRVANACEVRPNQVVFHSANQMRELQGVGQELKELKIVDRRPTRGTADTDRQLKSKIGETPSNALHPIQPQRNLTMTS